MVRPDVHLIESNTKKPATKQLSELNEVIAIDYNNKNNNTDNFIQFFVSCVFGHWMFIHRRCILFLVQ